MFEETRLLGISMTSRAHRRALVVITYAAATVLILVAAAAIVARPRGWYTAAASVVFNLWFVFLMIIGRGIFGRFVRSGFREFIGPPRASVQTRLGLAASAPEDEPATDEREVAVRDHAYRLAYEGLAIGTSFLFPMIAAVMAFGSPRIAVAAVTLATLLYVIVALTLPQAVILWTELDPIEESPAG